MKPKIRILDNSGIRLAFNVLVDKNGEYLDQFYQIFGGKPLKDRHYFSLFKLPS